MVVFLLTAMTSWTAMCGNYGRWFLSRVMSAGRNVGYDVVLFEATAGAGVDCPSLLMILTRRLRLHYVRPGDMGDALRRAL